MYFLQIGLTFKLFKGEIVNGAGGERDRMAKPQPCKGWLVVGTSSAPPLTPNRLTASQRLGERESWKELMRASSLTFSLHR